MNNPTTPQGEPIGLPVSLKREIVKHIQAITSADREFLMGRLPHDQRYRPVDEFMAWLAPQIADRAHRAASPDVAKMVEEAKAAIDNYAGEMFNNGHKASLWTRVETAIDALGAAATQARAAVGAGELKPCPFCGGSDVRVSRLLTEDWDLYGVECVNCGSGGADRAERETAIEDWNKRSSSSPDRDAYEGAREDLLDWKRRAQEAEAALKAEQATTANLVRALAEAVNGPTFMGEPALSAQTPGEGWMPIESAPRDGTWVLTFWQGGNGDPLVHLSHWLDNSKTPTPWAGWRLPSNTPTRPGMRCTHWMPLPKPPATPGEA